MRRRHRVKSIMLSKNGKGVLINTKGGSFSLPLNKRFGQRLGHYFPHLCSHFKGVDLELNDFLLGKYAYGISRDILLGKTVTKTLI